MIISLIVVVVHSQDAGTALDTVDVTSVAICGHRKSDSVDCICDSLHSPSFKNWSDRSPAIAPGFLHSSVVARTFAVPVTARKSDLQIGSGNAGFFVQDKFKPKTNNDNKNNFMRSPITYRYEHPFLHLILVIMAR